MNPHKSNVMKYNWSKAEVFNLGWAKIFRYYNNLDKFDISRLFIICKNENVSIKH
jgi:hypothetical protein